MEIQQPDALGERVSRRNVLRGGAAVLAASAMPQSVAQPARTPPRDAIYFASVADIAARIGRGELSSEEVVTACMDRIEAVNPALNAVVQMTPTRRSRGRGRRTPHAPEACRGGRCTGCR